MKKKIITVILLIPLYGVHAQNSKQDEYDSYGRYQSVPLAPELRDTYKKGHEHGQKTGSFFNTLFCEGFNWSWFCKEVYK